MSLMAQLRFYYCDCKVGRLFDRVGFSCKRERLGSANDSRDVSVRLAASEYSEDV